MLPIIDASVRSKQDNFKNNSNSNNGICNLVCNMQS